MESNLAKILFAVPAVKGVEFGCGFAAAGMRGSEHNDHYCMDKDGNVRTEATITAVSWAAFPPACL